MTHSNYEIDLTAKGNPMFKTLILASFITLTAAHADILFIGDSHTVGPFGSYVHKSLAAQHPDKMIMVYGHSSSAPIHWMSSKPSQLPGGLNHHMSYQNQYLDHPQKPDWRQLQNSIELTSLLENPVLHPSWKVKIPMKPQLDTIIIALGANDRNAVSTDTGAKTEEYAKRVVILDKMLQLTEEKGLKCIWIGPPASISRSKEKEQTTQDYLVEAIKGRCPIFDSRKFVAKFCDKVHFNCLLALPEARKWADEVTEFINQNL